MKKCRDVRGMRRLVTDCSDGCERKLEKQVRLTSPHIFTPQAATRITPLFHVIFWITSPHHLLQRGVVRDVVLDCVGEELKEGGGRGLLPGAFEFLSLRVPRDQTTF